MEYDPARNDRSKAISFVTSLVSLGIQVDMFVAGPVVELIGTGRWMIGVGVLLSTIRTASFFLARHFDGEVARRMPQELQGP